jgi:hypothetical protein
MSLTGSGDKNTGVLRYAQNDTRRGMPRGIWREISVQQIGRETLVYDGVRHRAFCLNESSGVVWRLADGTRTLAQLREGAAVELGAAVSEELVVFILDALRTDGLIEASGAGDERIGMSRRAMLQRLGVGGVMLLPVIAAIVAPTAAEAYNGCVDCDASSAKGARARRLQQSRSTSAPANKPLE